MGTQSAPYSVKSLSKQYRGASATVPVYFGNKVPTSDPSSQKERDIQKLIIEGVDQLDTKHSERLRLFKAVDKLLYNYLDETATKETIAAVNKEITEAGKLSFIPTPDPVVLGRCEDLIAYITETFIMKDPVFDVPPIPNLQHVSTAIEDHFRNQSQVHKWRPTLTKAIQNTVWYNFGPSTLDSFSGDENLKIRALDPRNVRYDTSVKLEDLAEKAMMASFIEAVSVSEVIENINNVNSIYLTNWGKACKANPSKVLEANSAYAGLNVSEEIKYKRSCGANQSSVSGSPKGDWRNIGANGKTSSENMEKAKDSIGQVTRSIIYRRMQPSWFNLNSNVYSDDESGKIPVYRFYFLGGTLMAIEPLRHNPYLIPMYIGACYIDESNSTPYTFGERIGPLQSYNDKLNDARMKAVKDSLALLEIYDENMLEKDEDGAYRVKSHSRNDLNMTIDQMYRQYRPDVTGANQILGVQQSMETMVTNATGDNRMLRGDHIPGNRTAPESNRILRTSEARVVLRSFAVQSTLIEPLQQDIQARLESNLTLLRYYSAETGQMLNVTSDEYAVARHFFEISDGLLPSSLNISPEVAQSLITLFIQIPSLQQLYDLKSITQLLFHATGVKGISRVSSPSVAQQEIQQRLQELAQGQASPQDPQAQAQDPNLTAEDGSPQAPNVQGSTQQ